MGKSIYYLFISRRSEIIYKSKVYNYKIQYSYIALYIKFINIKTCTYTIHILISLKDTNLIVTIRLEFVLNFSILDIN